MSPAEHLLVEQGFTRTGVKIYSQPEVNFETPSAFARKLFAEAIDNFNQSQPEVDRPSRLRPTDSVEIKSAETSVRQSSGALETLAHDMVVASLDFNDYRR